MNWPKNIKEFVLADQFKNLCSEDRGFLYMLLFFKNNEGVLDPEHDAAMNKRIQQVQHHVFDMVAGILKSNSLVEECIKTGGNPFSLDNCQVAPLIQKVILAQLVLMRLVLIQKGKFIINIPVLELFKNIFKNPTAPENKIINVFYLPAQIVTNCQVDIFFQVFSLCFEYDFLKFLYDFYYYYLDKCKNATSAIKDNSV